MFLYALMGTLWAASVDFITLEKGESAPFTGKLITHDALAGIIATHESELDILNTQKDYELQKQFDELTLKYDLYAIKCKANEEMYQKMIENRDKELDIQAKKDWVQRAAFIGGFAIGAIVTTGITYSVNQN